MAKDTESAPERSIEVTLEQLLSEYFDMDKVKNRTYSMREGQSDPLILGDLILDALEEEIDIEKLASNYEKVPWLEGLCLYLCRTMQVREGKNAYILGRVRGQIAGTFDSQIIIRDKHSGTDWHFTREDLEDHIGDRITKGMNLSMGFRDFFQEIQKLRHDIVLQPEEFERIWNDMADDMRRLRPNIAGSLDSLI